MNTSEKEVINALKHALERSMVALDDWLNLYASEFCNENRVSEARNRVGQFGTLAYIADTQEENRAALKLLKNEEF